MTDYEQRITYFRAILEDTLKGRESKTLDGIRGGASRGELWQYAEIDAEDDTLSDLKEHFDEFAADMRNEHDLFLTRDWYGE